MFSVINMLSRELFFTLSVIFLKTSIYIYSVCLSLRVDLLKLVLSKAVKWFKNVYCLYPHMLRKKYNGKLHYVDFSKYTTQNPPPMGDRLGVALGLMGSEDPADSAF